MSITLHHTSWSSHYKTYTYHFHDQMSTNTALLSSLLETRVLKGMKGEPQHTVTQWLQVYTETECPYNACIIFFLEITCILRLFWYIFRGDKMIHICVSTGWGGIEVRAGFFSVVHICYLYLIVFGYNSSTKTSMFANSRHLMQKMCSNSSHVQLWSC